MLLERSQETGRLDAALASVQRFGGQIVLVSGEAGVGKSSMIDTFVSSVSETATCAVGYCDPLATPRALGPVRDIAQSILSRQEGIPQDFDYFDGLIQHLLASHSQFVLVAEDLHWADQKSLDWLKYIGRRIAQLPVLLICSYRDDEVDANHPLRASLGAIPAQVVVRMALKPLSMNALRELAGKSGYSAQYLHEVTGGNPFFATELIASREAPDRVPVSVGDAVAYRMSTLSDELCTFLDLLSCAPGGVSVDQLPQLVGSDANRLAEEALKSHVIVANRYNLQFRHELARMATYERMTVLAQMSAHRRFLDLLLGLDDQQQPLDLIVHHAEKAADVSCLLEYARLAARKAAELGAHREAALHLKTALRLVDITSDDIAADIHESFAYEAGLALGIDEELIEARKKAIELWRKLDRPDKVGENLSWLSRLHWYRGEADLAQFYVQEAVDTLEREAPEALAARARAFSLRAQFLMLQDQMQEASTFAGNALAFARKAGDREIEAHALNTSGSALMFRGKPEGEALLRESLSISLANGFHEQAARVYTNLSECLIETRALTRAEELLEEGIAFDTGNDLDAWTYYLIGRKAQLRFEQDRYEEALQICQSVLKQSRQTLLMQMPSRITLARSSLRLGTRDAGDRINEALNAAQKIGEPQYLVTLHIARMEHAWLLDDPVTGEASKSWLDELSADAFSPRKRAEYLYWSRLLSGGGNESWVDPLPEGYLLALSGDYLAASTMFKAEDSGYMAAWCLALSGEADSLREADTLFSSINANPARKAIRRLYETDAHALSLSPLRRGQYRAARKHPYGLTAKEQTVLSLLASGETNAEIAQTLARSVRTVEGHVASILSKLNCRNRLEIALLVQSEAWLLADTTQAESSLSDDV